MAVHHDNLKIRVIIISKNMSIKISASRVGRFGNRKRSGGMKTRLMVTRVRHRYFPTRGKNFVASIYQIIRSYVHMHWTALFIAMDQTFHLFTDC